jgi:SAM-dependent methyltransferase
MPSLPTSAELQTLYRGRFAGSEAYRRAVWNVLISDFFVKYLKNADTLLDLSCGYGEFINQAPCPRRYAMDLNPEARRQLDPEVCFFEQDCCAPWPLPDGVLDLAFASNFFEHLPDKASLDRVLAQCRRCLKPAGRLIILGPNIKYLPGRYWDFWDHSLPLTERSLAEGLQAAGFGLESVRARFLPYTMSYGPRYPLICLRAYLRLPLLWKFFGRQYLVVAVKPA